MPILLMFLRYDYSRNRRRGALVVGEKSVGDRTIAGLTKRLQTVGFDALGWGRMERGLSAECLGLDVCAQDMPDVGRLSAKRAANLRRAWKRDLRSFHSRRFEPCAVRSLILV